MDEIKRKPLVQAVMEAINDEELSPDLERTCQEFEVEISQKISLPPRRRLRTSFAYLPVAYSYGTWEEGITVLDFPVDELNGVVLNQHYYSAQSGISYYNRRLSHGGRGYIPKMKALKRVLQ